MEYASNGKGNLAVTLGAIGTGLGLLGGNNGTGGILGNILGTNNTQYINKETFDIQLQLIDAQKNNALLAADLASEKKMVEVFNALNDKVMNVREEINTKVNTLDSKVEANAAAQAVINCGFTSANAVLQSQVAQLMGMTKLGIPNSSLCPGFGAVTVTPSGTGTTVG